MEVFEKVDRELGASSDEIVVSEGTIERGGIAHRWGLFDLVGDGCIRVAQNAIYDNCFLRGRKRRAKRSMTAESPVAWSPREEKPQTSPFAPQLQMPQPPPETTAIELSARAATR
jgi:hypothetical protein